MSDRDMEKAIVCYASKVLSLAIVFFFCSFVPTSRGSLMAFMLTVFASEIIVIWILRSKTGLNKVLAETEINSSLWKVLLPLVQFSILFLYLLYAPLFEEELFYPEALLVVWVVMLSSFAFPRLLQRARIC